MKVKQSVKMLRICKVIKVFSPLANLMKRKSATAIVWSTFMLMHQTLPSVVEAAKPNEAESKSFVF